MMSNLRVWAVYLLSFACLPLAMFHLYQERLYIRTLDNFAAYLLLWMLAPAMNLLVFVCFQRWLKNSSEALGLSLFYCAITVLNVAAGAHDPNGAGHMQLLTTPAFFLLIFFVVYLLVALLLGGRYLKGKLQTHR